MLSRDIGILNQRIFPASGLVSYWRLNEGTGTSVADSFGSNTGTASSAAQWVTGKNGYGYNLYSSNYINFGNIVSWTRSQAWSVSAWCKKYSNTASYVPVLSNLNSSTSCSVDCYFNQQSGNLTQALMYNNSSGRVLAGYTARYPANTDWHLVVFTYKGDYNPSNMRCYIDAVSYSPSTTTSTMSYTGTLGTDMQIGRRYTTAYADDCIIDEVALWSRELTQAEVTALYNLGTGIYY